jgi:arylsulfate sulfotransferase
MLDHGLRCIAVSIIACSILVLIGCGDSQSSVSISPSSAVVLPGQTLQFTAVSSAGATSASEHWQVNGVVGGSAATGTITSAGVFTAPAAAPSTPITVSVHGLNGQAPVKLFNPAVDIDGAVAASQHPLVASYSVSLPASTSAHVQFGPDTSYGFSTSAVPAPAGGGTTTILVAGMRANTTYHMQAILDMVDGSHVLDTDQTFTTGSVPADRLPNLAAQVTGNGTPGAGIELLSLDPNGGGTQLNAVATDLGGNVIWYYDLGNNDWAFPIKPMSNGHFLVLVTPSGALNTNEIREIDLAGNLVNTITIAQVNQSLAGVASFKIASFHHDILALPNGHYILLCDYSKTFTGTPGLPDGTVVAGDALVDWDPQRGAVWTWSTFDHLDPTRIPYGIANGVADWTHSNAIIASPSDGNLILSMRNQNWIIKINYQNGIGDGSILWHFGYQGDFTLPGQQAPIEWNYGQHYPTIVSSNSSGVFSLMFFNNGNARFVDSNKDMCGGTVTNCYSSVPIFQVNEFDKTANVLWEDNLLPFYSICCGNAQILPNGNVEFDVAFDTGSPGVSHLEEVTQTASPQLVWKMDITGQLAYRGLRVPSLYPGQTWPAVTQSSATVRKARPQTKPRPIPRLDELP